jgi:hypothetical protein
MPPRPRSTQQPPKTSPLAGRDGQDTPAPPHTLHVNSHGVVSYRRRKVNVGMQYAGRAVQATEDRGIVSIYLGHQLLREVLLGPPATYHGSGKPKGRPRKHPGRAE